MKKFSQIRKINEQEITLSKKAEDEKSEAENDDVNAVNVTVSATKVSSETNVDNNTQSDKEVENSNNSTEVNESKIDPVKLFSKLFESREMAHVYHLQVKGDEGSHAAHVALNEYYDGVLDLIDDLVETYTGQYDIVDGYESIDTNITKTKDMLEYFKGLAQFIKDSRYKALLQEDTHLQNIVDEVVALIYKTIYKLRFTK